jgi:hypothetical protein
MKSAKLEQYDLRVLYALEADCIEGLLTAESAAGREPHSSLWEALRVLRIAVDALPSAAERFCKRRRHGS